MSTDTRGRIRAPIRDKPCLASATTTFGRCRFTYDASGYVTKIRFYGEDLSGVYFDLNFEWDSSGYCRNIRRSGYAP